MAERSARAVELGKAEHGKALDLSPDSVQHVEAILENLHDQHLSRPLSEAAMGEAAEVWGAYIGETARRARPGSWGRDSGGSLVHEDGETIFPVAWAYKRISEGPDDNVWMKFQAVYVRKRSKTFTIDDLKNETPPQ